MNEPTTPRRPEEIAADWVAAMLTATLATDVEVASIDVEDIGQGFLGTVARIAIESEHPEVPPALVAKFPHPEAETRAQVWDAGIYQCEAGFYRHLAGRIPLRTPRCWFVANDPADDLHLLILDDLSGATLYDQLDGCPPARAYDVVEDLARLHATFWGAPDRLGAEIGRAADDRAWFEMTAGSIPAMLERDDLSTDLRWLTERYAEIGPTAVATLAERPTILHSDARIENVFFHPDGTRTWIDWDGIQIGGGAGDLAYFLSQSLTVDDRREHEAALIDGYVETVGRNDFTLDDAWTDYRRGIVAGWSVGLAVVGVYGAESERARAMVTEGIRRIAAAIEDNDALKEFR